MMTMMRVPVVLMVATAMVTSDDINVHPSLVTTCVSEKLGDGVNNIKMCIECFQEQEELDTEEGVDNAKRCSEFWLPRAYYDCQDYIDAMDGDNYTTIEEVLACFTDVKYSLTAEKCIGDRDYANVDEDEDVVETLTDGVLCIQDSISNLTNTINYIIRTEIMGEEPEQSHASHDDRQESFAEQMMSLVSQRHCHIATNSSEEETSCNQCFEEAAHNPDIANPQDHVRALAFCSTTYLSPIYEECSLLLEDLANNDDHGGMIGREIFLCFTRTVDRHNVETCSAGVTPDMVSAWTLLDVMACGQEINDQWVVNHVEDPLLDNQDYDYSDLSQQTTTDSSPMLDIF